MARKILYLVSEDWYFVSHRLPMARAAKQAGYEVHVATRVDDLRRRDHARRISSCIPFTGGAAA